MTIEEEIAERGRERARQEDIGSEDKTTERKTTIRRLFMVLAVIAVFLGLIAIIYSTSCPSYSRRACDPFGGLSPRTAGLILLAIAIGLVWGVVAFVRHRRRIASKAGDLSIDAIAGAVRLSRAAKRQATTIRDRVNERLEKDDKG